MPDLNAIKPALDRLQAVERDLLTLLIERDEVVRVALIALLSRQHVALLGAPGAAKTLLMTETARRVGSPQGGGLRCFDYLMTKFTTSEELFGPVSVSGLKRDEYRRITTGMLVEAELVFLDEVFKASSAILNTLLRVINERVYTNGGQQLGVPLISLFGASNELPTGNELEALWDRFLLRVRVGYLSDGGFSRFIRLAAGKSSANGNGCAQTIDRGQLAGLQQAVEQIELPDAVLGVIEQLRVDLAAKGIVISDRRWGQTLALLRAHALIEGRGRVEEEDLPILKHSLWQTTEQQTEIGRLIARVGNPLSSKAVDLGDQAASVHKACMDAQKNGAGEEQKMQAAIEANTKLKQIASKLQELHNQASAQGKSPVQIDKVVEEIVRMKREITSLVL